MRRWGVDNLEVAVDSRLPWADGVAPGRYLPAMSLAPRESACCGQLADEARNRPPMEFIGLFLPTHQLLPIPPEGNSAHEAVAPTTGHQVSKLRAESGASLSAT
jgi:hypothetical protein